MLRTRPSGSAYDATRRGTRVLAVPEHLLAVDEYVQHACRVLVRFDEGGVILNGFRIEDDHVGEEAFFQLAATVDSEIECRCPR